MKIEGMERLGSTKLIPWMKECIDIDEKRLVKSNKHYFHFGVQEMEDFIQSLYTFDAEYPDKKIKCLGFVFTTEE